VRLFDIRAATAAGRPHDESGYWLDGGERDLEWIGLGREEARKLSVRLRNAGFKTRVVVA
jgi:hypothetical protein